MSFKSYVNKTHCLDSDVTAANNVTYEQYKCLRFLKIYILCNFWHMSVGGSHGYLHKCIHSTTITNTHSKIVWTVIQANCTKYVLMYAKIIHIINYYMYIQNDNEIGKFSR